MCMLSNWQKKNWKLNFQSDNVIEVKENLDFNVWYHVKLLVLEIKSTVEVICQSLSLLCCKGVSTISKTSQKSDTV